LGSIPGVVPRIAPNFVGCAFRDRCSQAMAECAEAVPVRLLVDGHAYRCRLADGWGKAA
jgi:peptide/nickel transport system ATP-binding protein